MTRKARDVTSVDEKEWSRTAFTCTPFPTLFRYKIKFIMLTAGEREPV
jgi:hypothetical protein